MAQAKLSWIEEFETKFCITQNHDEFYIIIEGECRYLQQLDKTNFAVVMDSNIKKFFNTQNCSIYNEFDVISFLVTDWIKIQDSLEMIFNLLTSSSTRSLNILSYLREHKILAHEFAFYLYNYHKIIFLNRFTHPKKNVNRVSQLDKINKLLENLNNKCYYLIVGNREYKNLNKNTNILELAVVYHPSGAVLNINNTKYFKTWYKFDDKECTYKTDNFKLLNFSRLSI